MKTEDLKKQGLTDEQIQFVFAENGKDISALQTENATLNTARAELWSKLGTSEISANARSVLDLATKGYDPGKIAKAVISLYLVSRDLNI